MRDPERVVDGAEVDPLLADHVRAVVDEGGPAPRLQPHAVERIERRLEATSATSIWKSLRAPAYTLAVALVAVVVWEQTAPRPVPRVSKEIVAVSHAPRPLELASGSLTVGTDREPAVVETPSARIEIAPSSRVTITVVVGEHDVRIAASVGSARVLYHDGVTQLVAPPAVEEPAPTAAQIATRPLTKRRTHVAVSSSESAPLVEEPSPPANPELASLDHALLALRESPTSALPLLDEHLARYPGGVTAERALRARLAALLRLARRADALVTLDGIAAIPADLRVLRAELRCEGGRHEEAIADFGAVLVAGEEQFDGRALYGRAMCRQAMGDRPRMVEDLERYLARHPRGELADKARGELQRAR